MVEVFLELIVYTCILLILLRVLPNNLLRVYHLIQRYGFKVLSKSHIIPVKDFDENSLPQLINDALHPYFKHFDVSIIKHNTYYKIILLHLTPSLFGNYIYCIKKSNHGLIVKMCYPYDNLLISLIPLSFICLIGINITKLLVIVCLLIPLFFDTSCISFLIANQLNIYNNK